MARTKTVTGAGRTTNGRKHPAGAVAKNKVTSPTVKFADMSANMGQKLSIAGARMSEKMTYLRANVMLKLHRLQHPFHPVKKVAATETINNMKAAATGEIHDNLASSLPTSLTHKVFCVKTAKTSKTDPFSTLSRIISNLSMFW